MTTDLLIKFMVSNKILTQEEAYKAITTGFLPDDILTRLKLADKVQRN